jgi:hypothetical protein
MIWDSDLPTPLGGPTTPPKPRVEHTPAAEARTNEQKIAATGVLLGYMALAYSELTSFDDDAAFLMVISHLGYASVSRRSNVVRTQLIAVKLCSFLAFVWVVDLPEV